MCYCMGEMQFDGRFTALEGLAGFSSSYCTGEIGFNGNTVLHWNNGVLYECYCTGRWVHCQS